LGNRSRPIRRLPARSPIEIHVRRGPVAIFPHHHRHPDTFERSGNYHYITERAIQTTVGRRLTALCLMMTAVIRRLRRLPITFPPLHNTRHRHVLHEIKQGTKGQYRCFIIHPAKDTKATSIIPQIFPIGNPLLQPVDIILRTLIAGRTIRPKTRNLLLTIFPYFWHH